MSNSQVSKGNTGLGSYYWGEFRDNSTELTRLKKQASIGIEMEKELWKKISINEDSVILDIGCGPGIISSELAKFASKGTVLGMDKNKLMIDECCANREYKDIKNLSFKEGDVYELDVEDNSIDVVYSRFLFQHLSDPIKALKEIKRVLKEKGKVCIIDVDDSWLTLTPEPELFRSYIKRCQNAQKDRGGDRFVGHKLQEYLKEAGFSKVFSQVEMVTSNMINIKDLLDMIINYKYQLVNTQDIQDVESERANILALSENNFAWGAVGLFYAVGQ